MIYRLQNKSDLVKYVSGMPIVDGVPESGQVGFNKETGITHVKHTTDLSFALTLWVTNLKIGDIIRVKCLYKHISGLVSDLTYSYLNKDSTRIDGTAGKHRLIVKPDPTVKDFQELEMSFVYEGLTSNAYTPTFNNDASGMVAIRLVVNSGYGDSEFMFKDFAISTEHCIDGLYPSTRIYSGSFAFSSATKELSIESTRGSHNFSDFTFNHTTDTIEIKFDKRFRWGATCLLSTSYQTLGNKNQYELVQNTINATSLILIVIDKQTGARVALNDVVKDIYTHFLITGE